MNPILRVFAITLALALTPLTALHISMVSNMSRVSALAGEDFGMWKDQCDEREDGKAPCSEAVLKEAKTVMGIVLGVAERFKERDGKLTEPDIANIKVLWRKAYLNEANDSFYSSVANACADNLGEQCPDFLEIGSWKHNEARMELLNRDYRRE